MDIDNKLEHFMDISIKTATQQHDKIVEKYKAKLDRIFEDHKKEAQRKAALSEKIAIDSIQRAAHKEFSHEQVRIKRNLSVKTDKMKDELFEEMVSLLTEYKKTPEYYTLLLNQIRQAVDFSKEDEMTIYIDPDDNHFLEKLSSETGVKLTVSSYSFMGGTRAVIPSKNVLIDNSFKSKIENIKEHFSIES